MGIIFIDTTNQKMIGGIFIPILGGETHDNTNGEYSYRLHYCICDM